MKARPLGGGQTEPWRVLFHARAEQELLVLPHPLQARFQAALDRIRIDPREARPGADVKRLARAPQGILYRLRVGEFRAAYLLLAERREVWLLLFEKRERGYDRILATAFERASRLP